MYGVLMKFNNLSPFLMLLLPFVLTGCNDDNDFTNILKDNEHQIIEWINDDNYDKDYYATSTYKPNQPLFEPVLTIQRKRWDIARPLLEKLVSKNDPDAMYWLATISGGDVFSGSVMADLFSRSARLGNPYSALRLSPGAEDCNSYLKGYCSDKWKDVALDIFGKKAKNGDVKAKYFLEKLKGKKDNELLSVILDNARNHYFFPLYNYVSYNPYMKNKKELYSIMAKHRFIPVGHLMYLNIDFDDFDYSFYSGILEQIKLSGSSWYSVFNINSKFNEIGKKKEYFKQMLLSSYVLRLIENASYIKGNLSELPKDNVSLFDEISKDYNRDLVHYKIEKFTQYELSNIKDEAIESFRQVKPIIYIDEYYYDPGKI